MNDDSGPREAQDMTDGHDRATAKERRPREGWVTVLAWSPDGTLLASGGSDGSARIVDVGSGEDRHSLHYDGPVSALGWSPDGTLLAIACQDGSARILDVVSGEVRHRLQLTGGADDAGLRSGMEHGEDQLQDLQDNIDRARTQTGEPRNVDEDSEAGEVNEPETDETSDSDAPPPG
jgi:WD40 repeat protein